MTNGQPRISRITRIKEPARGHGSHGLLMLRHGALIAVAIVTFITAPAPRALVVAEASTLRAGAFKVDITPAPDAALPLSGYGSRTEGFKGIHDQLNVRAIVLDDGVTQAALVSC